MKQDEIKIKMNKLFDDDEWFPIDENDKNWKEEEDHFKYDKIPNIEYTIDDKLIDQMKEYNKLYEMVKDTKKTEFDKDAKVYKIYAMYNDQDFTVSYTTKSVLQALKNSIHKYLLDPIKNSYAFMKSMQNMKNVHVKLLGCYKFDNLKRKKLDTIKKQFMASFTIEPKNKKQKSDHELCIEFVENTLDGIISRQNKEDTRKIKFHIFEISHNNKKYFGYSSDQIKDKGKEIFTALNKSDEKLKNLTLPDIDFKIIKTYEAYAPIQCKLEVDKTISENNSIEKGYNKNYNLDWDYMCKTYKSKTGSAKINSVLFLTVQQELFTINFIDKIDYRSALGYIFSIKVDGRTYLELVNNKIPLREIIFEKYKNAIKFTHTKKQNRLYKALETHQYGKLVIKNEAIKKEKSKVDLTEKFKELEKKYNIHSKEHGLNTKKRVA